MDMRADKPNFAATMMAYVPYRDPERAIQAVLDNFPEAPCLPVLSRSMKHMPEGIPCLIFDREKRQVFLDPSPEREQELLEFYDRYEEQDLDYFATTQYSDKIALYHEEFKVFLERGGMLAWGIVPVTNELIAKENVQTLVERLEQGISLLVSKGVDEELLASSSWLLPSCDTIMMKPELSDLAFNMTKEISHIMRSKYGFTS